MKLIALLLLGFSWLAPNLLADQRDPELRSLFEKLKQAESSFKADLVVQSIWERWLLHPNLKLTQAMQQAADVMQRGDLSIAENLFTKLIEEAPDWAEAWNKRATVRYYQDDLEGSIADIEATLALEPRHFGALSGLGMIQIRKQDYVQALETYELLQKIYPRSMDVEQMLPILRQQVSRQYL